MTIRGASPRIVITLFNVLISIQTTSGKWEALASRITSFLAEDIVSMTVNGRPVRGYRSPDNPALWIRDHSDIIRGGKYIEPDLKTAVTCFAEAQAANGRIFDYVITAPESWSNARENWEKWVRVPVEADVEYRFVKAGYLTWQATGDDSWVERLLPAFDRALQYTHRHPWRWDETNDLVKRAYTIDTWDFDYTAGRHDWLNFQVTDDTFWGIMHGDNSGFYESCQLLAKLYQKTTGNEQRAQYWLAVAEGVKRRANNLLFNGAFYKHFYKLGSFSIEGVDEDQQLSLSNPMAINRGLATPEIARAILSAYKQRRASTGAFAEWFSIDPPFPAGVFGDEKLVPGAYINGGIMPLVGGELARAAFSSGDSNYGLSILDQYHTMTSRSGETYLWYFPDGRPSSPETSTSPEATATDGWGSSAMLYALVEGLCGIEDLGAGFKSVRCSPRWVASGEDTAEVNVSYAASGAHFGYRFNHVKEKKQFDLSLMAGLAQVELRLLLPAGAVNPAVYMSEISQSNQMASRVEKVGEEHYLVVDTGVKNETDLVITY